jgi:hypothetical protein
MLPSQNIAPDASATSLNGSAPPCEHFDRLTPVTPRSDALLVCLTCGWVACSNDSPNRHARAHYQETDHPVARGLELGSRWRWCYVHQRLV